MMSDISLDNFQIRMYNIVMCITWILYITIALGLSATAPQYLDYLQNITKIYVSLFLIYRFNPFRVVNFTKLDAKISFGAGVFLLTTTAINTIIQKYVLILRQYIELLKTWLKFN